MSGVGKYIGEVISIESHGIDVKVIQLKFDGVKNFNHIPGQFVMLTLDHIKNEQGMPLKRAYSIPNHPDADHIEICVKKEGVFSTALCDLKVGDKVNIEGPFGKFNLEKTDKDILLIAGGTGIAPIISMLRDLLDSGFKNKIDLLFSVRTVKDIIYREELEEYHSKYDNFNLHIFITREENSDLSYNFCRITEDKLFDLFPKADREVYICGGTVMVTEIIKNLEEIGFKKEQIHREVW